jgi:hypothetical protein
MRAKVVLLVFIKKAAKGLTLSVCTITLAVSINIQHPNFMKHRLRQMLHFFAFNLLFFAVFLNFIHKDEDNVQNFSNQSSSVFAASLVKKESKDEKATAKHIKYNPVKTTY